MKVFSIYDCKVEAFLQPFFMKSKGEVIRALTTLVEDHTHNFCKYSADFTLFELGEWDEAKGRFTLHATPVSILILQELKYKDTLDKGA